MRVDSHSEYRSDLPSFSIIIFNSYKVNDKLMIAGLRDNSMKLLGINNLIINLQNHVHSSVLPTGI